MKFIWFAFLALLGVGAVVGFFVPMPYLFVGEAFIVVSAACVAVDARAFLQSGRTAGQAESRLRNIFYNLEDAIIVYDKDFTIQLFNPPAERLFGLEAAVAVGHTSSPRDLEKEGWKFLTQVMFPSIAPTVVARTPAGEYPQVLEVSFTDPISELKVSTFPLRDESGKLSSFVKVVRDRTREVFLLRAKGEFLTIAAHQLRTPAIEILWAVESLARSEDIRDATKTVAETALRSARTLAKIIEDLLNVTRIEEGRFGYQFEEMDAVEFVKKVLVDTEVLARQVGIKVYFEKPKSPLPRSVMDAQKFGLAFSNIVENAIHYNVEKGTVAVKIEKVDDQPFLEIQVKDTGIGISSADFPKLFKKFSRLQEAMKAYTDGSGLGLYIAKNIVQAHGGAIWVDSEPGRGSIFHMTVPTDLAAVPGYNRAADKQEMQVPNI